MLLGMFGRQTSMEMVLNKEVSIEEVKKAAISIIGGQMKPRIMERKRT